MKRDIKKEIMDKITARIDETGTLPWDSGLTDGQILRLDPISNTTGKAYRGFNRLLLRFFGGGCQEYVTFNAAKKKGYSIKKGEHGLPVIFWKMWNKTKGKDADPKTDGEKDEVFPILRMSIVFEIGQTDGVEPRRKFETRETKSIDEIETVVRAFAAATGLKIETALGCGKYIPGQHKITVADRKFYKNEDAYYSTLFHEMVHSTMKAMGRMDEKKGMIEQQNSYSKEEVVAEVGAMFLCEKFGLVRESDNSAEYVKGWSRKLRENPDWLINGANAAEKAVAYILNMAGMEPATI